MTSTACDPGPEKIQTVRGVLGGDGECFHIVVTEQEYRRLCGDEVTDFEKESRARMHAEFPNHPLERDWTVGPSTVLRGMGFEDYDEVVIELRVRKVGQAEKPTYGDD